MQKAGIFSWLRPGTEIERKVYPSYAQSFLILVVLCLSPSFLFQVLYWYPWLVSAYVVWEKLPERVQSKMITTIKEAITYAIGKLKG